jgi:hypothetical protein
MERFRALAPQASQTPADNPVEFLGSNFKREIEYLLYNSVAPSKSKVYKHALEMLNRFRREFSLRDSWPIPLSEIVNFIAYMFKKGFAHSTVNCYRPESLHLKSRQGISQFIFNPGKVHSPKLNIITHCQ